MATQSRTTDKDSFRKGAEVGQEESTRSRLFPKANTATRSGSPNNGVNRAGTHVDLGESVKSIGKGSVRY